MKNVITRERKILVVPVLLRCVLFSLLLTLMIFILIKLISFIIQPPLHVYELMSAFLWMLNIVFVFRFILYYKLNIKKIDADISMVAILKLKERIDKLMDKVSEKESLIHSIEKCNDTVLFYFNELVTMKAILKEEKEKCFRKIYKYGVRINMIIVES